MNIKKETRNLQQKIKDKFNELINIKIELECCKEFIKEKRLNDEYDLHRVKFYAKRLWKKK